MVPERGISGDSRGRLLEQLVAVQENPQEAAWSAIADAWKAHSPSSEDWEFQHALGKVAWAFAASAPEIARAACHLITHPDIAGKTVYRIDLTIRDRALKLVADSPEEAVKMAMDLPPHWGAEVRTKVAIHVFPADRDRALELYREIADFPFFVAELIRGVAATNWRAALDLAERLPKGHDRDSLFLDLVETIARFDFPKAEELCDLVEDPNLRKDAPRRLLPHKLVTSAEDLFSLLTSNRYKQVWFYAFALHENLVRAWCGIPLLLPTGGSPDWPRVEGDEYWETYRRIMGMIFEDPIQALTFVREVREPAWRHSIFARVRHEYFYDAVHQGFSCNTSSPDNQTPREMTKGQTPELGSTIKGEARGFISESTWTFAKTMPEHPHEYTLLRNAQNETAFKRFVRLIQATGYDDHFFTTKYRYLDMDGWQYWVCEQPAEMEHADLINRARISRPDMKKAAPMKEAAFSSGSNSAPS